MIVETFTGPRTLVEFSGYAEARRAALDALDLSAIDRPIVDVVEALSSRPHAFTLECCYGHFLAESGQDDHSFAPIPDGHEGSVRYRIAYLAFCVEDDHAGRTLLDSLSRVPEIDPGYVQFGSADWFWNQWLDSYVLQVAPAAHMLKDQAVLSAGEALCTQRVRGRFFDEVRRVLTAEK